MLVQEHTVSEKELPLREDDIEYDLHQAQPSQILRESSDKEPYGAFRRIDAQICTSREISPRRTGTCFVRSALEDC